MLRPTTNPYIQMLDAALTETEGVELLRFDRARALRGDYDVLHLHWPETLLGGRSKLRAVARRLAATAIVARMLIDRKKAIVRTAHNVELPRDVTRWERALLERIERRADLRIVLNPQTRVPGPSVCIPHGHYRDWFADVPRVAAEPNSIGFVGLIRRYKGVEHLLATFHATRSNVPELRLSIAGNPTSTELAAEVTALARRDDRVRLDLRFLGEADFATAIMRVRGLVLPYRFMHNSGAVLAALSLDRPVLVPASDVNAALDAEVGPGWVHQFDGDLTASDLANFHVALDAPPPSPPRLDARNWDSVGAAHREAFEQALAGKRA